MKKVVLALAVLWVGRWAVLKIAHKLSRLVPETSAKDSPRRPGYMPGPFDG